MDNVAEGEDGFWCFVDWFIGVLYLVALLFFFFNVFAFV